MPIKIISEICNGCQLCIPSCPYGAIGMEGDKAVLFENCIHCAICIDSCPVGAIIEVGETGKTADSQAYRNILIIGEVNNNSLTEQTKGLLNKARSLANAAGISVWMAGADINDKVREEVVRFGINEVFDLKRISDDSYNTSSFVKAVSDIIETNRPEIVFFSKTPLGCDVAPRIAQRFNTGIISGCISLEIDTAERILHCTRPVYGGRLIAVTSCRKHKPQIAVYKEVS